MIGKVNILVIALGALLSGPPSVTVHLIGDSTVSTYPADYHPRMGWGQVLDTLFNERVSVSNHAVSGRSTRSFIQRGDWAKVVEQLQAGDYLFIQFGHNDQKQDKPELYAAAFSAFQNNLRRFVREARQQGCHPVLITPVARRRFRGDIPYNSHESYPVAVRQVAQQEDVPLIDLHTRSLDELATLGPEGSKALYLWLDSGQYTRYPQGLSDDSHFSEYGALQVSRWVAEAVDQLDLPLEDYLRNTFPVEN